MEFRAPVLVALSTIAVPCQVIVVNPAGGGNFTDLQAAIDAAPAGATIHVIGGIYGPITITRSLTIVGAPVPRILPPVVGIGTQPPAITLQGTGSETMVFAGIRADGTADGARWGVAGAALSSSGFARILVYDSTLIGSTWFTLTGSATGAHGIVANGAALVVTERCTVRASLSDIDTGEAWVPNGVAAIAAPGASVVALDSTITGGGCGPAHWRFIQPGPSPCPCGGSGAGGPGIAAAAAFVSGGAISGGLGSIVTWQGQPWGHQPDGPAFLVGAQTTIQSVLMQATPLRLGTVGMLSFPPTTVPSVLAIGSQQLPPTVWSGVPFVFLSPAQPVTTQFLPPGSTTYSLAVPNRIELIGFQVAQQRFDLAGGLITATNAILDAVRP